MIHKLIFLTENQKNSIPPKTNVHLIREVTFELQNSVFPGVIVSWKPKNTDVKKPNSREQAHHPLENILL